MKTYNSRNELMLARARIRPLFIRYAAPGVVAMLFLAFQSIVDGLIVGRLIGANALAAVNIVAPTYALISALTLIIGVGAQAQMSIYMGRGSYVKAKSALRSGLTGIVVFSVIATLFVNAFAKEIAVVLGANETLLPLAVDYISREESKSGNNIALIFGIFLVLVYLILCGLYESFFIPFAVILAVPCGLTGSFLFAQLFGLENNVYMQTGIIMLIGLLAKTAILLTEYATKRREAGMSLVQAAYTAAKVRLRPILMTALTMVFGMIPLMFSNGVGANGNRSLASGAVGGMLVGTLVLLFLVPALFIVFQYLQEKFIPVQSSPKDADWSIQAELETIEKKKKHETI